MTDRRAHLTDRDLYRHFYEADQSPGYIYPMALGEPRLQWVLEHLGPADDVIDIGCHKGEMTVNLWSQTTGRVVGVDISRNALHHARAACAAEDVDIAWVNADAEHLPFPDASFDVAVLCEILEHVPDVDKVVAEAERVTRPGGVIVVSVPFDALKIDAVDALERDPKTGFALDMHVRELVPHQVFADKPGARFAGAQVTDDAGTPSHTFLLASWRIA